MNGAEANVLISLFQKYFPQVMSKSTRQRFGAFLGMSMQEDMPKVEEHTAKIPDAPTLALTD